MMKIMLNVKKCMYICYTKYNLVMNGVDNNGQSAAKFLSINIYGKGSTTISREESTTLTMLEKVDTLRYTFDEKLPRIKCVYGIFCKVNNKLYVGSCLDLNARIIRHRSYLKRGRHHSPKLQRVYNKYDIANFQVIVIEKVNYDNLNEREEYWINELDSFNNGFNCTNNCRSYSRFNLTKDQVQKRTESCSKKVICLDLEGNYVCEYKSISEAARTIKDQTTNISSCCKGKARYVKDFIFVYKDEYDPSKDYTFSGRKYVFTEEHKQKISLSLKNRKSSVKQIEALLLRCSIPIAKYDLNNNLIKLYKSMKDCRKDNKIEQKKLRRIINSQTPLGGFLYKECENIV